MIGLPDPLMGEEVVAFVVLRPGQAATADEVAGFCQTRLAKYKCPEGDSFRRRPTQEPCGQDPPQGASGPGPHTAVRGTRHV